MKRLFRYRWPWIVAIALAVMLWGLAGCANTPIPRSTDTPAYAMQSGQMVTVVFKPREQIAEYARKNLDTAYRVDAVAFPSPIGCVIWMPEGSVNTTLLDHELAHCAGLTHDRYGQWIKGE